MPVARYESAPVDISPLAQSLKFEFSGRTAKNRLFKAAMAEDLATWHPTKIEERGIPTKELIELYGRYLFPGENEWGVITTGNIDIELDKVDSVGDMIVTPESAPNGPRSEAFKKLAAAAKAHGSLFIAQVTHPGRQLNARICKDTISASAIQILSKYAKPREATKDDIARLIDGFSYAAEYLQKAGFDGIELHAAHGYLLSQFLSETSNQRTDEYGGSLQNRLRLVIETAEAIKRRTQPGFILGIKINSVEFQAKGLNPAEVRTMCEALQEAGFDFDTGYGGGGERESTRTREAYFLEFVRDIVPELTRTRTRTFLVGGFRTAASMVRALEQSLDGISLGRPAADILAGRAVAAYRRAEAAARSARRVADGDGLVVRGYPKLAAPETSSHPYGVAY
ncbi:NADH:flavin oxidoreductase/NADH oxidase-like protein [Xylaria cf. heliscus]|nr:NADH:flavin oxidoreductase/NADH oxidase-like protein [Xylaria cf. heliscus]